MMKTHLLEKDIQAAILRWLRERTRSFTIKLAAGPYTLPGIPDILHIEKGRAIFIEVKRPGENPTPLQIKVMDRLLEAGAVVGVARSVEDAKQIVGDDHAPQN